MNTVKFWAIAVVLGLLSACGGGGGGGSSSGGSIDSGTGGSTTVTKDFTVSLSSADLTRPSNGDIIEVDVSAVSQTGTVTVSQ